MDDSTDRKPDEIRTERDDDTNDEKKDDKRSKRIKNPRHWPLYRYSVQLEGDLTDTGVGCYIRAMRSDLAKHELQCTLIDNMYQVLDKHPFDDNADVISNLISLENKRGNDTEFELPIVLSFPHLRYRKKSSREVVLRVLADGEWKDYSQIKDSKLLDFLESNQGQIPLLHSRLKVLNKFSMICVVNKSRAESIVVRGGKAATLIAALDNRISLKIPKGAFDDGLIKVEMQPLPNNPQMTNKVKKYFSNSENLYQTSPVINFKLPSKINAPLILTMPVPGTFQSKSLKVNNNIHLDSKINKNLMIVTKMNKKLYRRRDDIRYEINNDVVTFPIRESFKKIFLFETANGTLETDVENIARNLEFLNTKRKLANIIIRQHEENLEDIFAVCCNLKEADNELAKMEDRGYTVSFQEPSIIEICVQEDERLRFKSKGNVRLNDEIPEFRFLNSTTQRFEGILNVEEKYAQRGRFNYYGIIELMGERKSHCEIKVELPKQIISVPPCQKIEFQIRQKGFLTSEYLQRIAQETAMKWKPLAISLSLSNARVDSISLERCSKQEMCFKALQQWFKQTTLLQSGCKQLFDALQDNGFTLLAEQLSEDYQRYKEDDVNSRKMFLLQKAIHKITFDADVQCQWELIVERLNLPPEFENELKSINSVFERLKKAFDKWIDINGGSMEFLLYLLKDVNLINASRMTENLIRENQRQMDKFP